MPLQISGEDDSAESSGQADGLDQLQADALGLLAEAALGQGLDATERGEAWQVVVHVDAPVLAGLRRGSVCDIEDGSMISAETCRRLACDASLVAMAHGSRGEVIEMGRKTRKISLPLWRALKSRDRTCRFPGCSRKGRLAAHHIRHWAAGGETESDNLILLCRAHHWAVHEGGFLVERRADGDLVFLQPDGSVLPSSPPPHRVSGIPLRSLKDLLRRRGEEILLDAYALEGHYEPMDYDLAVTGLVSLAPWRMLEFQGTP